MYFVIKRSSNNQFYFVIKSENHEIVATSETYFFKESAEATINSIKREINSNSIVVDMTV
ncbi:YegP family protein [Apilactobacillus kunkeei]|uniref:YegP family protein n=1 Tax=Apilactobacillus kunkeei TaxID=148814 RepID=UPI0009BE1AE2|nr:YegP family protein [Apilactobacillus kunkeei]